MAGLARKEGRWGLPDLMEWFESSAPMTPWRNVAAGLQPLRIEELTKDGAYVVRVEVPGIDPEKDVEITISGGILRIQAERGEEHTEKTHTEFRYGAFVRSVQLPATAMTDEVSATYKDGILTVSVPLGEEKESVHRVSITSG